MIDALAVRDAEAPLITDSKSNPEAHPDLRDNENGPLPDVRVTFATDPSEWLKTIEYRTAING